MNITDKNSYAAPTAPRAVSRPPKRPGITGRLISLAMEIPPAAYVALTGTVPLWARIWLGVWLSIWLMATVVQAAKSQVSKGSSQ